MVEVVDIDPGKWAAISGYIIQGDVIQGNVIQERGTFVPFSAVQRVPPRENDVSLVPVNVAATGLTTGKDVKVIARTAEVQIWPTVLSEAAVAEVSGIAATWQARNDAPGLAALSLYGSHPTVPSTGTDSSISLTDMEPGYVYHITVEKRPK